MAAPRVCGGAELTAARLDLERGALKRDAEIYAFAVRLAARQRAAPAAALPVHDVAALRAACATGGAARAFPATVISAIA